MILTTEKEAEKLTSFQAGGISPSTLENKGVQVIIDATAEKMKIIHVSGSRKELNIKLPVLDLAGLTGARITRISKLHGDGFGMSIP